MARYRQGHKYYSDMVYNYSNLKLYIGFTLGVAATIGCVWFAKHAGWM